MTSIGRYLARVVGTFAVAATVVTGGGQVARADTLPYSDPSAVGSIGLCGPTGLPVLGGSVNDKPFVASAVSSVPAPATYQIAGRKATLLAYQPQPNTTPDLWNGDTLTAGSVYTNIAAPTAVATRLDFSLADFVGEYAPLVDGLIQLRMYFGAPGQATDTDPYPAVNIRVTGSRWNVVDPASVSCTSGTATSSEVGVVAALNTDSSAPPLPGPGSSSAPGANVTSSDPSQPKPKAGARSEAITPAVPSSTHGGPLTTVTSQRNSSGRSSGAPGSTTPSNTTQPARSGISRAVTGLASGAASRPASVADQSTSDRKSSALPITLGVLTVTLVAVVGWGVARRRSRLS